MDTIAKLRKISKKPIKTNQNKNKFSAFDQKCNKTRFQSPFRNFNRFPLLCSGTTEFYSFNFNFKLWWQFKLAQLNKISLCSQFKFQNKHASKFHISLKIFPSLQEAKWVVKKRNSHLEMQQQKKKVSNQFFRAVLF